MSLELLSRLLKNPPTDIKEDELYRLRLNFNHFGLDFLTNNQDLYELVKAYHAAFLVTEAQNPANSTVYAIHAPGLRSHHMMRDFSRVERGQKIKEEFADIYEGRLVRKKRTGVEMFFDGHNHLIYGSLSDNLHQVNNFINVVYSRHYLVQKGYLLWNTAAFGSGFDSDGVVAFAGLDGSSLSSAMMRFMERGYGFCTFDRLMIKAEGDQVNVLGYPTLPAVNAAMLLGNPNLSQMLSAKEIEKLESIPKAQLMNSTQRYYVDIARLFGKQKYRIRGCLKALYLIKWTTDRSQQSRIRELKPQETMKELSMYYKDLGVFDLNNTRGERLVAPNWMQLRRIFDHIRMFSIEGLVSFDEFANHVKFHDLP